MLKNNNLICNNIFRNQDSQERKDIFIKKMSELINQLENSSLVGIYKQDDHSIIKIRQTGLFLSNLKCATRYEKRGDKI